MSLQVSLRSENLKLKRTLSLYLCVFGSAFGPFMSFLEYIDLSPASPRGLPWTVHFMKGREPLCIALLPLYVILICALLLHIEYRDKTWKQVLSSPQKLIDIFLAKFITLQFMILAFLLGYNLFLTITAFSTEMMHPGLYEGKIDFYKILTTNAQTYIQVLGVSAIQFWLSLRFKNFIAPLAIGIGLWFLAPMMLFGFKWTIIEYYPYAYTMLSIMPEHKANLISYQWYSIMTTVLFLSLAFVEFRIRKVVTQ
ncbi:MAG: hypothetical protein E6H09_07100 [Bacteroidetes bacterium]|nr:MAG: hypothetical protein E6H09_07100 [Bacteroidota bacterium]